MGREGVKKCKIEKMPFMDDPNSKSCPSSLHMVSLILKHLPLGSCEVYKRDFYRQISNSGSSLYDLRLNSAGLLQGEI